MGSSTRANARAVDARGGCDLGAERPHGEPAEAADRPEAVRLSLRLGHRSAPVDVEREVGGTDAERLAVDVHHERHALHGRLTAVEPAYGGCRREACDVDARDLHTRRQRVGRARIDERDGHEQHAPAERTTPGRRGGPGAGAPAAFGAREAALDAHRRSRTRPARALDVSEPLPVESRYRAKIDARNDIR